MAPPDPGAEDARVREAVYRAFVETARAPAGAELAGRLGMTPEALLEAYRRLQARRVLVVAKDGESILMAPPFSGVATQHRVRAGGLEYHANCSWDALGVAAALRAPATVLSRCEQSGEPLTIPVGLDGPEPVACIAHFAVPAAHWWDDIEFT